MHETVDAGLSAKTVHVWVSDFVLEEVQRLETVIIDENGISISGTDLMGTGFNLNEFVDS